MPTAKRAKRQSTAKARPRATKKHTFKDLALGQTFVFGSEGEADHHSLHFGLARGPWVKVSARGYVRTWEPKKLGLVQVGSISVEVTPGPRASSSVSELLAEVKPTRRRNAKG